MSKVHKDIADVTQMANKQKLSNFSFNQENVD